MHNTGRTRNGANATEAGNNRFIGRRDRGRRRRIALVLGVLAVKSLSSPGLLAISTLLLPIATIVFASIFVYRHTARRRKLQAFLTALLATLAHPLDVHVDFSSDFSRWTSRPSSTWSTRRVLTLDSVQSNLRLDRTQCIDNESNVFVKIDAQLFNALLDVVAIY